MTSSGEIFTFAKSGDRVSPPELQAELADAIPGARLLGLADCGHVAPLEQPGRVAAALAQWLGPPTETGVGAPGRATQDVAP